MTRLLCFLLLMLTPTKYSETVRNLIPRCFPSAAPYVDWKSCFVQTLQKEDMQRMPFMRALDVQNNNISQIDKDAFELNRELQQLNLANNPNLSSEGGDSFVHSKSIMSIDLSDNPQLGVLGPDKFAGTPNLVELKYYGNVGNCELTRKLLSNAYRNLKVKCSKSEVVVVSDVEPPTPPPLIHSSRSTPSPPPMTTFVPSSEAPGSVPKSQPTPALAEADSDMAVAYAAGGVCFAAILLGVLYLVCKKRCRTYHVLNFANTRLTEDSTAANSTDDINGCMVNEKNDV